MGRLVGRERERERERERRSVCMCMCKVVVVVVGQVAGVYLSGRVHISASKHKLLKLLSHRTDRQIHSHASDTIRRHSPGGVEVCWPPEVGGGWVHAAAGGGGRNNQQVSG